MADDKGLPRLHFRVPQGLIDRIQAQADKAGMASRTELIITAVKLYLYLADRRKDGASLALIERDDTGRKVVRELVFPE